MTKSSSFSGVFGAFGGQYVPDTLMSALEALETAYLQYKDDVNFQSELRQLLATYVGRPSPLYFAKRLSASLGIKLYLKREDLNHTGAHKINNTLGQILLAKQMGKTRIIAETGAGQHGVATATVCALMGMDCVVYMGETDVKRQALNVYRMELLGAKVVSVTHGDATLKEAVTEAIRDWMSNVEDTHYIIGSALGPHPFPLMVRDFQRVIGVETKRQIKKVEQRLPDVLVACVGGGSNALGFFHPFLKDKKVRLVGVEAAGDGLETARHAATLIKGTPGILHGTKSLLLQDKTGQVSPVHSISAGLDYPGVAPELSDWVQQKRIEVTCATDQEALAACRWMALQEGLIPALETAHAVAALQKPGLFRPNDVVVLCVSGRGDKDMETIREYNVST